LKEGVLIVSRCTWRGRGEGGGMKRGGGLFLLSHILRWALERRKKRGGGEGGVYCCLWGGKKKGQMFQVHSFFRVENYSRLSKRGGKKKKKERRRAMLVACNAEKKERGGSGFSLSMRGKKKGKERAIFLFTRKKKKKEKERSRQDLYLHFLSFMTASMTEGRKEKKKEEGKEGEQEREDDIRRRRKGKRGKGLRFFFFSTPLGLSPRRIRLGGGKGMGIKKGERGVGFRFTRKKEGREESHNLPSSNNFNCHPEGKKRKRLKTARERGGDRKEKDLTSFSSLQHRLKKGRGGGGGWNFPQEGGER